jgi:hypothetical protein
VPGLVTVDVNVTGVPVQILLEDAAIDIDELPPAISVLMALLVAVLGEEQVELVVTTQVITSPKFKTAE